MMLAAGMAVAQDDPAGTYKGKWNGASTGGDFTLQLEKAGAAWKATVQFTLADNPIPTTVKTLKLDGKRLEIAYEFDLGGNKLLSQLEGELTGGALTGKYKTKALADGSPLDEGTCEAKRYQ